MNVVSITRSRPSDSRAETELLVSMAARTVPPLWPLEGAIAVNPLAGLEHLAFEDAVRVGADLFGARAAMPLAHWRRLVGLGRIDRAAVRDAAIARLGGCERAFALLGPDVSLLDCVLARLFDLPAADDRPILADRPADFVAKWCAAFFDTGNAALPMPGREAGFYHAVLGMLPYDGEFAALAGPKSAAMLGEASRDPVIAIAEGLEAVASDARLNRLRQLVARLPGWAGHLRWRTEYADPVASAGARATMADLIALMMLAEHATTSVTPQRSLLRPDDHAETAAAIARHFDFAQGEDYPLLAAAARLDDADLGLIFQVAAEHSFRDTIVPTLSTACTDQAPSPSERPDAQLVFCIDVRSEPFRRAIEAQGDYETFGYAGFFGLPIAVHPPHRGRVRQLPVLVAPQHDLALAPVAGAEAAAAASMRAERRAAGACDLFDAMKGGAATGFATAEATGPLGGVLMLTKTLLPSAAKRLARRWSGDAAALAPALGADDQGCGGLSLAEQTAYARALFALTGMPRAAARLVVLAGHRGQAVNNPYGSALDCGACAGNGGGPNARALAGILNAPAVRGALAADGEAIAPDCWFIAAEHDTTTDEVTLFDLQLAPPSHRAALDRLRADLARAGQVNRARRATALGRAAADLAVGAAHWGEVRPEWGLAGNAAFIVGPRALTRDVDLGGRAFLHSYDWRIDADGEALATILTAPMVVAQWINCQYLFSTLDNRRYGAGDKIVHNAVGRIGVLRGNGGDLCVGLPMQSLFEDEGAPAHVPQRLLTIVHAPFDRVAAVIEGQAVLRRLFGNGWVQLVTIDPQTGAASRWRTDAELGAPMAFATSTRLTFPMEQPS